jgi:hypothetical protein
MKTISMYTRIVFLFILVASLNTSCKPKDNDPQPAVTTPAFRTNSIDYNTLTGTTSYRTAFVDANGDSTVDRNDGRTRLLMFKALDVYIKSAASSGVAIDSATMSDMFRNQNNPFTGSYTSLNTVGLPMIDVTATSAVYPLDIYDDIENAFGSQDLASQSATGTASKGVAGKSGNYLLDTAGVEWAQVISKAFIGAYQVDYICNVLLNTGLNANNNSLVAGHNYTALEHNWDEAYGFLTNNDIYAEGATDAIKNPTESFLGSYVWEYNKAGYPLLYAAFLKGRAAVHNNDMVTVRAQALIIRGIIEKAIGAATKGYMTKAADGTATEASRAHAFGEGYGFVYATRFCTLTGANAAFSDELIDDLFVSSTTTFYDITVAQYTGVSNKLIAKFNL